MRRTIRGLFVASLLLGTDMAAWADDQGDAKAVIEKAIKATGSPDKLTSLKPIILKSKGKVKVQGTELDITVEVSVQPPHKQRVESEAELNGMKFRRVVVLNGDKGWVSMGGNVEELKEAQVEAAKEDLYATTLASLVPLVKDPAFQLTALGEAKDGEHTLAGVKVAHKGHTDVNLYFDKETGLLAKVQRKAKDFDSGSDVDRETAYSEYKDFEGVKRPRKLVVKQDDQTQIELEITEYKSHDKLDDSLFEKPAQ